eukprot:COSAG01_NODE_6911_length_3443_cov_3.818746_1_plen_155_part_00
MPAWLAGCLRVWLRYKIVVPGSSIGYCWLRPRAHARHAAAAGRLAEADPRRRCPAHGQAWVAQKRSYMPIGKHNHGMPARLQDSLEGRPSDVESAVSRVSMEVSAAGQAGAQTGGPPSRFGLNQPGSNWTTRASGWANVVAALLVGACCALTRR